MGLDTNPVVTTCRAFECNNWWRDCISVGLPVLQNMGHKLLRPQAGVGGGGFGNPNRWDYISNGALVHKAPAFTSRYTLHV